MTNSKETKNMVETRSGFNSICFTFFTFRIKKQQSPEIDDSSEF